jgi:hypothetical protein
MKRTRPAHRAVDWGTRAAVGLFALMIMACRGEAAPSPAASEIVVESGVTALATAPAPDAATRVEGEAATDTSTDTAPDTATNAGESAGVDAAPPDASAGFPTIDIGADVQARGMLRIYAAAAPETPTLAEYAAGDRFVVLGPPGDITVYPVELNGVRWYRVRAGDGLVGWVIADGIEPVADEEP